MPDTAITQAGLDRVENNLRRELEAQITALRNELEAAVGSVATQLKEIDRRLGDLNNSHDKAVAEKKRTDEAALQVQERTVTRLEFQTWKDEVNRIIATEAGKNLANARTWAAGATIAVILINIAIRYLSEP